MLSCGGQKEVDHDNKVIRFYRADNLCFYLIILWCIDCDPERVFFVFPVDRTEHN